MNNKVILIIILISGIYFYKSLMYNLNIESMTNITSVPTKSKYLNIKLKNLKHMPLIDVVAYNEATKLEMNRLEWNGKLEDTNKILNIVNCEIKECNNKPVTKKQDNIKNHNFLNIKNRKNIIKLIPFINPNTLQNVNYKSLKTFINQHEPSNLINIIKLKKIIPQLLNLNNTIIINNYLYKITQFGIIKYIFNNNFRIDDNATVLNASFESTILNDINLYNKSNHPIVILKGEPYKIINNKIYHIKTNQVFELNIPDDESPINEIEDESPINEIEDESPINEIEDESFDKVKILLKNNVLHESHGTPKDIIKIFHNQDKMYTIQYNKIYPNEDIGIKINNFIKENVLNVNIITPLFYLINGQLISRTLFICNSNLYFYIENNSLSKEKSLSIDQYNTVLSQISLANNINNKVKINIIDSLSVKFSNP